jgi:endonuclease YncB( thermonuclease family)
MRPLHSLSLSSLSSRRLVATRTVSAVPALLVCLAAAPGVAAARPPPAATLEGLITQVGDGNTVTLTPERSGPVLVRLRDIDAPGLCQPWGEEARRALSEWALNRPATVRIGAREGPGRVVGLVLVEGANLNQRMVEEGHAWSIRTRWDQGPMVREERMAHSLGRGLHGVSGSMMPRDFRRAHGACPAASVPH